ncbi:MAG: acyl dehydratase [Chloroflexota bacterium]|nr:acyl dehydratase [Chloroflexota bacterium]
MIKLPTIEQLVMFAGATWEFARIHYDAEHARREGLPGPILQGPLQGNYLAQLVMDWTGGAGELRRLRWRHHLAALVNQRLIVGGKVLALRKGEARGEVECDLWVDNADGQRITTGRALVVLPYRQVG